MSKNAYDLIKLPENFEKPLKSFDPDGKPCYIMKGKRKNGIDTFADYSKKGLLEWYASM